MPRTAAMEPLVSHPLPFQENDQGLRIGHGLGEILALETWEVKRDSYFRWKRWMDVLLSGGLLVLLFPLWLLIAILIKLDSRGPVIFRQKRMGARRVRRGANTAWILTTFVFYKFRSMFDGVDTAVHEAYIRDFVEGRLPDQPDEGGHFKLTGDPRVTRVGKILRKTSLDELPQLLNVLKGEMSLVGPRPVLPYEVGCYSSADYGRLAAPPGITGLWQVHGRCRVPFAEMVRLDREYIRKASLWLDLKLLLQTIPAVLSGRGAE